ncbi:hypothetical protein CES85_1912 [Ochrobactrum quorumnocens]|uniref:Uncharacterized protein n=1 Tax=Ochrobactrum quorumnocens TaxID=271865 RepID=A0A248UJ12_9HYPH|nr:hypothetical protein CES85_1912 [[Ochrobactrum] quorumnocens]
MKDRAGKSFSGAAFIDVRKKIAQKHPRWLTYNAALPI